MWVDHLWAILSSNWAKMNFEKYQRFQLYSIVKRLLIHTLHICVRMLTNWAKMKFEKYKRFQLYSIIKRLLIDIWHICVRMLSRSSTKGLLYVGKDNMHMERDVDQDRTEQMRNLIFVYVVDNYCWRSAHQNNGLLY